MFIGHYAPAFAGPKLVKTVPLWVLFLSVQFVDLLWSVFIMLGIERVDVIPGFTEMSPFDLAYMPYTHSLLTSVGWAVLIGGIYGLLARYDKWRGALIVGLASLSHWFLDLLVHVPDMPLWPGGPEVGFGLWNNATVTIGLEVGLVLVGYLVYMTATLANGVWGKISPFVLLGLLGLAEVGNLNTIPPNDPIMIGSAALLAYAVLILAAAWVDHTRRAK